MKLLLHLYQHRIDGPEALVYADYLMELGRTLGELEDNAEDTQRLDFEFDDFITDDDNPSYLTGGDGGNPLVWSIETIERSGGSGYATGEIGQGYGQGDGELEWHPIGIGDGSHDDYSDNDSGYYPL